MNRTLVASCRLPVLSKTGEPQFLAFTGNRQLATGNWQLHFYT
jgi:hypothetical protein